MRRFLSFMSTMIVFGFGIIGWYVTWFIGGYAHSLWKLEYYLTSTLMFGVAWCGLGSGFFIGIGVARWALPRVELYLELLGKTRI